MYTPPDDNSCETMTTIVKLPMCKVLAPSHPPSPPTPWTIMYTVIRWQLLWDEDTFYETDKKIVSTPPYE